MKRGFLLDKNFIYLYFIGPSCKRKQNKIMVMVKNIIETEKLIKLTNPQISMLKLSDRDIKDAKLISQTKLDQKDYRWLKGLRKA